MVLSDNFLFTLDTIRNMNKKWKENIKLYLNIMPLIDVFKF